MIRHAVHVYIMHARSMLIQLADVDIFTSSDAGAGSPILLFGHRVNVRRTSISDLDV
jgi:hypothetical protein